MTAFTANRRDLLKSSVGTAGAIAVAGLTAARAISSDVAFAAVGSKVVESTSKCIKIGEACETHCIAELGKGNKEMASCLATVRDMLASCTALLKLASADSKHAKAMAKLCADVCADCAKACEPHAKHMEICKHCHEACLECEKACKEMA